MESTAREIKPLGAPNLTDEHLAATAIRCPTIRDTITNGRVNQMPAHLERLGETKVRLLAAYVLSLSRPAASAAPASAPTVSNVAGPAHAGD